MRPIKFRAWDKNQKRWMKKIVYNLAEDISLYMGVAFCQFTGLKDKHATEIYEGDLIIHSSRNGGNPHVITFERGAFHGDYGLVYPLNNERFDDKYCEIEVIGNIHENPELLRSIGDVERGTKSNQK